MQDSDYSLYRTLYREEWIAYFARDGAKAPGKLLARVRRAVAALRDSYGGERRKKLEAVTIHRWIKSKLDEYQSLDSRERLQLARLVGDVDDLPKSLELKKLSDFLGDSRSTKVALDPNTTAAPKPRENGIPRSCALLIVEYLLEEGFLQVPKRVNSTDSEVALASALHAFFATNGDTRNEMGKQFEGYYFVYRRSAHWPGRYVKASLKIEVLSVVIDENHSAESSEIALRTVERHVHHGKDGSAPASETYLGVLSRKSSYPFILSSLSNRSCKERGAPRFTLIHSTVFEESTVGKVASMVGITVSPFGQGQSWTSPVCIERCFSAPSDDDLGLFGAEEESSLGQRHIPPSVIARLLQADVLTLQA